MSEPANPSTRRTWLFFTFSVISLVFFYLVSFGPMLYLASKTGAETKTWFKYSFGAVYTPHLWCMFTSESYYDYSWWWYSMAKPTAQKPAWEEWKRDR